MILSQICKLSVNLRYSVLLNSEFILESVSKTLVLNVPRTEN